MKRLFSTPLDQLLANYWGKVDPSYRKAIFFVVVVNLLAFGYEMTNLTLHHDDVLQIFIKDATLGYDLGRFGLAWLHYYGQNAYFMPLLQMAEGIALMTAYGVLMAYFWGVKKTTDIILIASIVSVFPFMAQIYQYNTAMAPYPLAHLLAATAIFLSARATFLSVAVASILYVIAFSIYQSVIANAAAIFLIWALGVLIFNEGPRALLLRTLARSAAGALVAVIAGSLVYLFLVSAMNITINDYQGADQAFKLNKHIDLIQAATEIAKGTRSFFFWPENYFPEHLKKLQLIFLLGATFYCLWLPRGIVLKITAGMIFILVLFAPRLLQLIYPAGNYHNLTLTGYAVVIAGFIMIVVRSGQTPVRNLSMILASGLIAGYVMQCNWISTVNQLNTYAHYATMSQILGRIKSLPAGQWDGKKVMVVGKYDMPSDYPYRPATGVATEFIDAHHAQKFARLMREEITFMPEDETTPTALEYAAKHSQWPHPDSVGVVDGVAVVVLSKKHPKPVAVEQLR